MAQAEDYLTAVQAAQLIGVSRKTLLRWRQTGKLVPDRKLPGHTGHWLYDRAKVEAFAKHREAS